MPTVFETKRIIDIIAANPEADTSRAAQAKLGLDDTAIKAWRAAKANPDSSDAIAVKNKVFNIVAENLPVKQDVNDTIGFVDRFKLQNLIDRDPDLQTKYLQKKGYDAKVIKGQVVAKKPGDAEFTAVDPEGFDRFDVFDIFGDALEAVVSSAAGVGAAALASPTGPGAIAAGVGAGAATAGAFEYGKQQLAKAMGLREETDIGRVAQQTAMGGMAPVVAKGAVETFKLGAKAAQALAPKLREGWDEIAKAGASLKIVPALRQKYDDKLVSFLEESFEKSPTFLFGRGVRKAAAERTKSFDEAAEKIVGRYSDMDYVGMGEKAKKLLVDKISTMLKPIEETYDKLDKYLLGQKEFIEIDDTVRAIANGLKSFKFDDATQSALEKVGKKLNLIESIGDIKSLRTVVGKDAALAYRNGETQLGRALDTVYDGLTTSRNKSLEETIKGAETTLGADTAEAALQALRSVDQKFAEVADFTKQIFLQRGEATKLGVRRIVENFDEVVNDSQVLSKIINVHDPEKLEFLRTQLPEAFEVLRDGYLAKLAQSTTSGLTGKASLNSFLNKIVKLPKPTQQIMFGEDYLGTIKNIQKLAESMPAPLNPSGTAWTLGGFKEYFVRELGALGRTAQLKTVTNLDNMAEFMAKVSKGFESLPGKSATQFSLGQSFETDKQKAFRELNTRFALPQNSFNPSMQPTLKRGP